MRSKLETVFKKFIRPGQIVLRQMPNGNEHAVLGFTTHFVVDINIVCRPEQVHKRLAALLGSDFECQTRCQCQRRLLNDSMTEATSRQTGGPTKQRIMGIILAEYLLVSQDRSIDFVNATSFANSPGVNCPNSATGHASSSVRPSDTANPANDAGSSGSRPAVPMDHLSGCSREGTQPLTTFVKGQR